MTLSPCRVCPRAPDPDPFLVLVLLVFVGLEPVDVCVEASTDRTSSKDGPPYRSLSPNDDTGAGISCKSRLLTSIGSSRVMKMTLVGKRLSTSRCTCKLMTLPYVVSTARRIARACRIDGKGLDVRMTISVASREEPRLGVEDEDDEDECRMSDVGIGIRDGPATDDGRRVNPRALLAARKVGRTLI